tara:strand:- start:637 stop:2622 length:1986 start_codon:yes stop_codon:yes gene_type:complete
MSGFNQQNTGATTMPQNDARSGFQALPNSNITQGFDFGSSAPGTTFGTGGPQQLLTRNLSNRYDPFRGLLGPVEDMRANLILNTIEDQYKFRATPGTGRSIARDPTYRFNLAPQYFAGDAASTDCPQIATEVAGYLLELRDRFAAGNPNDLNVAQGAIQAVNSFSNAMITTAESQSLQVVVDSLFETTQQGLVYKRNAFNKLLELLGIQQCAGALNQVPSGTVPAGASLRFDGFLPNKLALQKFLEATEESNRLAIASPSVAAAPEAVVPENVFYKKVGQPGKTFTLDANGNEVEVQAGSAIYQQLTEANQCFGTGIIAGDANECNDYFIKCLAGKDITECKSFMENANFWNNAENAVSTMLPDVLLATLDSFGFKAYDSKTSTGRNYRAYPSAEEWITTLKASLGNDDAAQATVDAVRGNARLMGYLNMIVARVNSNPGIANPTYVEDGPSYNPNAFVGTLGSQYGIKGKAFAPRSSKARPAPTPTAVSALENTVVNYMGPLGLTYGITPFTAAIPIQRGGADELDISNENRLPLKVSDQLNEMYESILENLQHGGKDLDGGDQETIKKMINELNVLENKLFKSSSYVQGYEDLISTQAGGSLVTESNLEKFVAKRNDYFNRVNAKYQSIFPIFSKLAEACQKETINSADVVTAEYYPKA